MVYIMRNIQIETSDNFELGALRFDGIKKHFGRTYALKCVSHRVCSGEFKALLGENGAGKTSLVKVLGEFIGLTMLIAIGIAGYAQRKKVTTRSRRHFDLTTQPTRRNPQYLNHYPGPLLWQSDWLL